MNISLHPRAMRNVYSALLIALALLILLAATLIGARQADRAGASSHREAPLISMDPAVDSTDVYAFVSPDLSSTVTLIANWIPFEDPTGGPNFYHFDDNARYRINVDRDGDAFADVVYEWKFHTVFMNQDTFLYNIGQISAITDTDFTYRQYYTVTEYVLSGTLLVPSVLGGNLLMPPDNIGPRSIPNYAAVAAQAVRSLASGTIKEFTGQRDDPFFVDIGSIFDLGGLRPFNSLHIIPLPTAPGIDSVAGFNIHTTAIQVPKTRLAPGCTGVPTSPTCVIGVWTTAERPNGLGGWVQVSRLGNPLVNEAVLPLALKDAFSGLPPDLDYDVFLNPAYPFNLLAKSVLTPELGVLIPVLYSPAITQTPATPRNDLVTIFLTGIPTLTMQTNSAANPSEQLRLNVAIPPSAGVCAGAPMAAIDGDFAGFPNGRRLEDDVTDIALRAVAGGYGSILQAALGLPNFSPNNLIGDGVSANDVPCLPSFPYMGTPHSSYQHTHVALTTNYLVIVLKNAVSNAVNSLLRPR